MKPRVFQPRWFDFAGLLFAVVVLLFRLPLIPTYGPAILVLMAIVLLTVLIRAAVFTILEIVSRR